MMQEFGVDATVVVASLGGADLHEVALWLGEQSRRLFARRVNHWTLVSHKDSSTSLEEV
jgi:hypothetical protein